MSDLITRLRAANPESPLGKLCSEAADALGDMQWQPIETAPKDGTHILVINSAFLREGEMSVAFWHTFPWQKPDGGHWDVTGYGGYTAEPEIEPTHWMTLPKPASTLTDEAKLRRSAALDELGALDGELLANGGVE